MSRPSLRRLLASLLLLGFALTLVQGRGATSFGPEKVRADAEAFEDGETGEAGPELLGPLPGADLAGPAPAHPLEYELAGTPGAIAHQDGPRGRHPGRAPPRA